MKYITKKPKIIEATQHFTTAPAPGVINDYVITIQGVRVKVIPGDYVITEPDGVHFYPCQQDVFESQYQPLEENKVEEIEERIRCMDGITWISKWKNML